MSFVDDEDGVSFGVDLLGDLDEILERANITI